MNKSYLYTETAFHHEGDFDYLKSLIDQSELCGARGVKFQVMTNTSDFISTKHSAYTQLNNYAFSKEQWSEIFEYTLKKKLDIIMMPLNIDAFSLLDKYKVRYIDIHSVSFYDDDLMNKVKESGIEIILGVGGRTIDEIIEKKNFFGDQLKILMTGFQSFPSNLEDVKIGKIHFLNQMFPECHIGYADHSAYDSPDAITSNYSARLLGATFFEKHITINEGVERIDFSSAISGEKIKQIIDQLSYIDSYIMTDFTGSFEMTPKETTYRNRQLVCVAARQLMKGHIITNNDILLKLIDSGDTPVFYRKNDLINKQLVNDIDDDQMFSFSDIE